VTLRASKLCEDGPRPQYGIITHEIMDNMFARRLLAADYLSHSRNPRTRHAAYMVRETLIALRKEMEELIS
jgi:hypothetical protein